MVAVTVKHIPAPILFSIARLSILIVLNESTQNTSLNEFNRQNSHQYNPQFLVQHLLKSTQKRNERKEKKNLLFLRNEFFFCNFSCEHFTFLCLYDDSALSLCAMLYETPFQSVRVVCVHFSQSIQRMSRWCGREK